MVENVEEWTYLLEDKDPRPVTKLESEREIIDQTRTKRGLTREVRKLDHN